MRTMISVRTPMIPVMLDAGRRCEGSSRAGARSLTSLDVLRRTQQRNPFPDRLNRLFYALRRRSSGNVVDRLHLRKFQPGGQVGIEYGMDRLQVRKRQVLQLAATFQAKLDGLANRFMREP